MHVFVQNPNRKEGTAVNLDSVIHDPSPPTSALKNPARSAFAHVLRVYLAAAERNERCRRRVYKLWKARGRAGGAIWVIPSDVRETDGLSRVSSRVCKC